MENLCLLEGCKDYEDEEHWKMHDLIRDMALQILKKRSPVMVRAGMQLEELPDVDEWEEDLETVSLMHNSIKEITCGYSPICPRLSTLLLCHSKWGLRSIDDSFTSVKMLPSSISNLARLTALLLRRCVGLKHVPSLGKLQELKTLDLSNTRIEQVPHGMELLHRLRYLNMYDCSKLEKFPAGILPNLTHLQLLILHHVSLVGEEEVGGLKHLKYLNCRFHNIVSFNNYMQSQNHLRLDNFKISVFPGPHISFYLSDSPHEQLPNMVILSGCHIGREFYRLPQGTAKLVVVVCKGQRSLFPLNNAAELRCIEIIDFRGIECLGSLSSSSGSSVHVLEQLEELCLEDMESLQVLIRFEDEVPPDLPSYDYTFAHLKKILIGNCHGMKKLFPPGLLPNLKNLETITVFSCKGMEEIIASEEAVGEEIPNNTSKSLNIEFNLAKLRSLKLHWLPGLKSICSSLLICRSLKEIEAEGCRMLKRIP